MSSRAAFEQSTIYHIHWLGYSLTLGAVLVIWVLSPPTGYASSPYGASIDASCVIEMSQFVYRVFAAFIQSPYAVMLLFEGSWNLSRPFLSYLDFACRPFLVQLLFLPHYIALLSTLCWMMGDALIPFFEQISSHRLQIIDSGIGV